MASFDDAISSNAISNPGCKVYVHALRGGGIICTIVARSARKGVVAGTAGELVVPRAAGEAIVARAAIQQICAVCSIYEIVPCAPEKEVS